MKTRDFVFVIAGIFLTISGIFLTIFWDLAAGISALLLLGLLVLILLVLERRQVAKLQERVLSIIRSASSLRLKTESEKNPPSEIKVSTHSNVDQIAFKKILGILQAQQMSMEILDKRIATLSEDLPNSRNI